MDTFSATFLGEDHSMGFRTGGTYRLRSYIRHNQLWIVNLETGAACPYASLVAFLRNWRIVDDRR